MLANKLVKHISKISKKNVKKTNGNGKKDLIGGFGSLFDISNLKIKDPVFTSVKLISAVVVLVALAARLLKSRQAGASSTTKLSTKNSLSPVEAPRLAQKANWTVPEYPDNKILSAFPLVAMVVVEL